MSDVTNESYVVALKKVGFPDKIIADRLGIKEADVQVIYDVYQKRISETRTNHLDVLVAQFNMMLYQYQLLGESLKIFAQVLNEPVQFEELVAQLEPTVNIPNADLHKLVIEMLSGYIILKPLQPVDPEKALKRSLQGN